MVICLRCGWCCKNISPLIFGNEDRDEPLPCPHLEYEKKVAICKIYERRPIQCKNEHMGAEENEPCSIGQTEISRGNIDHPTGKCLYCGGVVFNYDTFCSDKCGKKSEEEFGTF